MAAFSYSESHATRVVSACLYDPPYFCSGFGGVVLYVSWYILELVCTGQRQMVTFETPISCMLSLVN